MSTVTIALPDGEAAQITGRGFEVTAYISPEDGQPVIEIDTTAELGEVRVYVNDGQVYAADPEER